MILLKENLWDKAKKERVSAHEEKHNLSSWEI